MSFPTAKQEWLVEKLHANSRVLDVEGGKLLPLTIIGMHHF